MLSQCVFALPRKWPSIGKLRNLGNVLRSPEYVGIGYLPCSTCCSEGDLSDQPCPFSSAHSLRCCSYLALSSFAFPAAVYLSSKVTFPFVSTNSTYMRSSSLLMESSPKFNSGTLDTPTLLGPSASCTNLWTVACIVAGAGAEDLGARPCEPDPCAGGRFFALNSREERRSQSRSRLALIGGDGLGHALRP